MLGEAGSSHPSPEARTAKIIVKRQEISSVGSHWEDGQRDPGTPKEHFWAPEVRFNREGRGMHVEAALAKMSCPSLTHPCFRHLVSGRKWVWVASSR